jgi:hypothetical protein
MNETSFSLHLLYLIYIYLFIFVSPFSFILEYLRAAAYLSLICLQSFHHRFPEFYSFIMFLKKSSKIKFLEKFQKNLFKFLYQKWGREAPGRPQGDLPCHLTTRGRGPALAAPIYGEGGLASHLSLPPQLFLSPEKQRHTSSNLCSCCSPLDFSISLLSPSLLLRFGAFVLRYICDSFDCPSRILFSGVYFEYFSSIGDS